MVDQSQANEELADLIWLEIVRIDIRQQTGFACVASDGRVALDLQKAVYNTGTTHYSRIEEMLRVNNKRGIISKEINVPRWGAVLDSVLRKIEKTQRPADPYHPNKWQILSARLRKMDEMQNSNYASNQLF